MECTICVGASCHEFDYCHFSLFTHLPLVAIPTASEYIHSAICNNLQLWSAPSALVRLVTKSIITSFRYSPISLWSLLRQLLNSYTARFATTYNYGVHHLRWCVLSRNRLLPLFAIHPSPFGRYCDSF